MTTKLYQTHFLKFQLNPLSSGVRGFFWGGGEGGQNRISTDDLTGWTDLFSSFKSYICKNGMKKKMSFYLSLQFFHNIPVPALLHLEHLLQVE